MGSNFIESADFSEVPGSAEGLRALAAVARRIPRPMIYSASSCGASHKAGSMTRIIQGVFDFQQRVFASKRALYASLRDGQRPLALFITCADSRIDPNLLTQTEPGELFVLRNAGNVVPPADAPVNGEGATIEYAVRHLRVRDIILCGHSQCGAMQGLASPEAVAELPHVRNWLNLGRESVARAKQLAPHAEGAELLQRVVEKNVLVQMQNLQTYSAVRDSVLAGHLRLHAWVYGIENGQVTAYDPECKCFVPLVQSPREKLLVPIPGGSPSAAGRDM